MFTPTEDTGLHLVTADGPGGSSASKTPKRVRAGSRDRAHSDDTASLADGTPRAGDGGGSVSFGDGPVDGNGSPMFTSPDAAELMGSPEKVAPVAAPEREWDVMFITVLSLC